MLPLVKDIIFVYHGHSLLYGIKYRLKTYIYFFGAINTLTPKKRNYLI